MAMFNRTKYYRVHLWDDFGDGESGPMPDDWWQTVKAESVGDAWLMFAGSVCVIGKDEDGCWIPDIRPATEREKQAYIRYEEEAREYRKKYGGEVPFDPEDILEAYF